MDMQTGEQRPVVATWMERYASELRRHVARLLAGDADVDDVLQDVWLAAHRHPPRNSADAPLRGWLFRVATNAALDRLDRERRRTAALRRRGHELPPSPVAPAVVEASERVRVRVREAVARLPRKQREAVWLKYVEDMDYESVARRLDCAPQSARANAYQGMKKLRQELAPLWAEERAP